VTGIVAGRQVSSQADSDTNFQLIRDWMHECLTAHRYCATPGRVSERTFPLPTRVIDVTYEDPRLVEPQGESGLYVALSHCWGKSRTVVTDTSTLSERKEGIEFFSLPKTFQDALMVTRRLGYRYLWIDSLCILQDSQSDWQREASRMGNYYGQAQLTISATNADGDHAGFLKSRTSSVLTPVELNLTLPNGGTGKIFVALEPPNAVASAFYRNVEQSPTKQRAWIFQERVLSPRILHFGKDQIFWECGSFTLSEDGSRHSQSLGGLQRGFGTNLWLTDPRYGPSMTDASHIRTLIRYEWLKLVMEYTKRSLTNPSDKLPAISGLAHKAPEMFRTQYCAGLWESGVRHNLDWIASKPSEPLKEYRAPSWSWAAVDGPVSFTDERSLNRKMATFGIENISVELLSEDEYGQIRAASLTLCGYFLSVNSTQKPFLFRDRDEDETGEDTASAIHSCEFEVTDKAGNVIGWSAPDRIYPAPKVFSCLPLYHCKDKYDDEYYSALFLEAVDLESSPHCFRRFGRGSIWNVNFQEMKKQVLVII
jgi:Heterokaryon incompatibility protein (HET)